MSGQLNVDVVVVGAGFGGLFALYRLRSLGLSVRVFEAGDDVGGTWYWNRYPGARCDVPSFDYSYSFDPELEQEWEWSERYAAQPEILAYLQHVADRYDLRKDISFSTRVESALFDEVSNVWIVRTDSGEVLAATYCVMAAGPLSTPSIPDFPGRDSYRGSWYHTAQWPRDGVDFTGRRVGVIGTGSSGVQAIPLIAEQAEYLTVFQRTPNFSTPARNHALDPEYVKTFKSRYREYRAEQRADPKGYPPPGNDRRAADLTPQERRAEMEARWAAGGAGLSASFADVLLDRAANDVVVAFVHEKIRETVRDPEVASVLCPRDYPIGAKRACLDTNYYATYNRDNVTLVDLRATPIEAVTPNGIRTVAGHHELDCMVLATGFDALTGSLLAIDIRGRGGTALADAWAGGPASYLGLAVAGFPNLFTVAGPGSPSVLSNMVLSIEQHVEWIGECLEYMANEGLTVIEADAQAQESWMAELTEIAAQTLFPATRSWYTGANIPGKPRTFALFLGGVPTYRRICDDVAAKQYKGFCLQ